MIIIVPSLTPCTVSAPLYRTTISFNMEVLTSGLFFSNVRFLYAKYPFISILHRKNKQDISLYQCKMKL